MNDDDDIEPPADHDATTVSLPPELEGSAPSPPTATVAPSPSPVEPPIADPYPAALMPTAPRMLPPRFVHAGTGLPFSDKSRKTAGLLQILLGGLGIGRFYLGYPKVALLQILVTWGTCGAGVIWPVLDGVRMLEGRVPDAQGRPLRED